MLPFAPAVPGGRTAPQSMAARRVGTGLPANPTCSREVEVEKPGAPAFVASPTSRAIAATSSGRMTVQQQSFVQPASSRIPVHTTITNVIATLQGTASPERFYVATGHLD